MQGVPAQLLDLWSEAVLMALKQAAPQSVMLDSNGEEEPAHGLHGPGCSGEPQRRREGVHEYRGLVAIGTQPL